MSEQLCNQCGQTLCPSKQVDDAYGLVDAEVSGGYFSEGLLDMTTYRFSLCEQCLRAMFRKFKVPPKITCDGENVPYEQEARDFRNDRWRREGGENQKLPTGRCNATMECERPAVVREMLSGHLTNRSFCLPCAERYRSMNSDWVSEELVADIPVPEAEQTGEQTERVLQVWLGTLTTTRPTWFRVVSETVRRLTRCPEKTGAIWLPADVARPEWLAPNLNAYVLRNGTLFYAAREEIEALVVPKRDVSDYYYREREQTPATRKGGVLTDVAEEE
jgi:hypothetical protein